jgi:hypothetical protein
MWWWGNLLAQFRRRFSMLSRVLLVKAAVECSQWDPTSRLCKSDSTCRFGRGLAERATETKG